MIYAIYFWLTYLAAAFVILLVLVAMMRDDPPPSFIRGLLGVCAIGAIALCPLVNLFIACALVYDWTGHWDYS